MHPDEFHINANLVRELLTEQFPNWSKLDLQEILPKGTDNAMFKLASDKLVRLPRTKQSATNIEKELLWLPKFSSLLPIAIPTLLGSGSANKKYPLPWVIYNWLEGKSTDKEGDIDLGQAAVNLGNFVVAMQKIDPTNGPKCNRGQPLNKCNKGVLESIESLKGEYDTNLLTKIWESTLETPAWSGDPVWIHGDLHSGNILVKNKKITAIVDFGLAGIGDPAADMMLAWTVLDAENREIFRSIAKPDDHTWARGRGWAFALGALGYPYYRKSNPEFAHIAKRSLDEVIADFINL